MPLRYQNHEDSNRWAFTLCRMTKKFPTVRRIVMPSFSGSITQL